MKAGSCLPSNVMLAAYNHCNFLHALSKKIGNNLDPDMNSLVDLTRPESTSDSLGDGEQLFVQTSSFAPNFE